MEGTTIYSSCMRNPYIFYHCYYQHMSYTCCSHYLCAIPLKAINFTHVVRFEWVWRTAVVSQELCNLLSKAEREQD